MCIALRVTVSFSYLGVVRSYFQARKVSVSCGMQWMSLRTSTSTDLAYRESGSLMSKYVVCE